MNGLRKVLLLYSLFTLVFFLFVFLNNRNKLAYLNQLQRDFNGLQYQEKQLIRFENSLKDSNYECSDFVRRSEVKINAKKTKILKNAK
jgi:hypothetical protein